MKSTNKKEKQIEPSIYKSKVYKDLMKEVGKLLKIKITSTFGTPEDKEKAKLLQKIINYQFEHNSNGITDNYFRLLKVFQKEYVDSLVYGVKVNLETTKKFMIY